MSQSIWKPTQAECELIKRAAALESSPRATVAQLRLEPGIRYNVDDESIESSFNIALVTSHEHWDDTDLEQAWYWSDFRKGVPLTEDGRAVVDFYIRPRTDALAHKLDGLLGNVVAYYADGKLAAIRGTHSRGEDYLPKLLK